MDVRGLWVGEWPSSGNVWDGMGYHCESERVFLDLRLFCGRGWRLTMLRSSSPQTQARAGFEPVAKTSYPSPFYTSHLRLVSTTLMGASLQPNPPPSWLRPKLTPKICPKTPNQMLNNMHFCLNILPVPL
jgi:hypothetical protein